MARTEYVITPQIPGGLAAAVEGLAREILRQRPQHIYAFAANHFEELIKLRDKEDNIEIVSKTINDASLNEPDCNLGWTGFNSSDAVDSGKDGKIKHLFSFSKHGDPMSKEAVVENEQMISLITKKGVAAVISSKNKRKTTSESGWSINGAIKVLKRYKYNENDVEDGGKVLKNARTHEKLIQKTMPDYYNTAQCSPGFAKFTGNTFTKDIRRQLRENREKFNVFNVDKYRAATNGKGKCDTSYRSTGNLRRQKSADQIEGIFGGNNEIAYTVGRRRRRSRSLVNNEHGNEFDDTRRILGERRTVRMDDESNRSWKDKEKAIVEHRPKEEKKLEETCCCYCCCCGCYCCCCCRRRCRCRRRRRCCCRCRCCYDTRETAALEGKNKKESKEREKERRTCITAAESPGETSESNIFSDSIINMRRPVNRTALLVFPSVTTPRQSTGKFPTNNIHESNEENSSGNLTLPPISSDDALKLVKKECNLLLPCLSNGGDARSNMRYERTTCDRDHQGFHFIGPSEERCKGIENLDSTDSDRSGRKETQKECKREIYSKRDANEIILRKYSSHKYEKAVATASLGNPIKRDLEEMEAESLETLESGERSDLPEINTEVFKDSLNDTPDSIDFSQRSDSLEHERSEKKEEEEREQCRSNDLKEKLIEIETVEKSIENTLALSSVSTTSDRELKQLYPVGFDETILVTKRRKQQVYPENEWTEKNNRDKSESSCERDNRNTDGGIEIDGIKSEGSVGKISSDNLASFIADDNIDTYSLYVRRMSNEPLNGIDRSCYILTEGSPCEIPETVTTVILPDKAIKVDNDTLKFGSEEVINEDSSLPLRFKKPDSTLNVGTQEGSEEDVQREEPPFGEYVRPEVFECSTIVHAYFSSDLKDVRTDRASACQDLGNIKEEGEKEKEMEIEMEMENESDRFSNKRRVSKSTEVMDNVEYEATMTTCSNGDQQLTNRNEDDANDSYIRDATGSVQEQERSEVNDLKTLDNRSKKEASGNITSYESENVPLFSLDKVTISGVMPMSDESFSLKNEFPLQEKEPSFTDPEVQRIQHRSEVEKRLVSEFKHGESPEIFVRNEDEESSRRMEEEIARELIENFVHDTSVPHVNMETRNANFLRKNTDSFDSTLNHQPDNNGITTEQYFCYEEIDDNAEAHNDNEEYKEDGKEGKEEGCGGRREMGNEIEDKKEDEDEEEKEEEETGEVQYPRTERKEAGIVSLRHTGEFHDSLPLPLFVEISQNTSVMNVYTSQAICETTNRFFTFQRDIIRNRGYTGALSLTSFHIKSLNKTTVPRAINVLENFRLLSNDNNNSNYSSSSSIKWTELPLYVSPWIIHIGHAFDETCTSDETAVPLIQTIVDSGIDDIREPLALDNIPKPIVIEEISDVDEEKEQQVFLSCKMDADFATEPTSFSSKEHSNFEDVKDNEAKK